MNKDNEIKQDTGASEWDYPNGRDPGPHKPMYYGNQRVPHPTNTRAKTAHANVMEQVLRAK